MLFCAQQKQSMIPDPRYHKKGTIMKKTISLLLTLLLLLSFSVPAYAATQSRAVIAADLTEEQIEQIYAAFGVRRGSVVELRVTNQEERQYLEGYVDPTLIGSHAISSVYVELLPVGSGMNVTTSNITWCTPEMYMSALATAGITDARVVVAAPYGVSGTAALTGVYKAYEDMTGRKLDDLAKLISTQELSITGTLASEIGSMDSTAIVNELKMMLDETSSMSDAQIRKTITEIAGEYGIRLSDTQINQLISLCRSLETLDTDTLLYNVQYVQGTLNKLSTAKTEKTGLSGPAGEVIDSIGGFFDRIGRFLGL